jgi:hypothetical protein
MEWTNAIKIRLVDGTEKVYPNTANAGSKATAEVWVKNETPYDFGITEVSFSDPRVQVSFSSSWIYPQRPVSMKVEFPVPDNPTEADIIKSGKIDIKGYYIFKEIVG